MLGGAKPFKGARAMPKQYQEELKGHSRVEAFAGLQKRLGDTSKESCSAEGQLQKTPLCMLMVSLLAE